MPTPVSPKTGRHYGHIPSKVLPTDKFYADHFPMLKASKLPASVSLLPWMGAVKNQLSLGACTAFAGSEMREYLSKRFVGTMVPLSPLFLYFVERQIDGDISEDVGSSIATTVKALHEYGICPETDDPYVVANFAKIPTQQDYSDAKKYVTGDQYRLANITDMQNTLNNGFVFELGFLVYSSFESDATAATGIMTMPAKSEQLLGGHAVCCWGYSNTFAFPGTSLKGALMCRNSWGAWGNAGNFYMPYAYVDHYVSDCHMAHLGTSWH